jgi:hypothetical protein
VCNGCMLVYGMPRCLEHERWRLRCGSRHCDRSFLMSAVMPSLISLQPVMTSLGSSVSSSRVPLISASRRRSIGRYTNTKNATSRKQKNTWVSCTTHDHNHSVTESANRNAAADAAATAANAVKLARQWNDGESQTRCRQAHRYFRGEQDEGVHCCAEIAVVEGHHDE